MIPSLDPGSGAGLFNLVPDLLLRAVSVDLPQGVKNQQSSAVSIVTAITYHRHHTRGRVVVHDRRGLGVVLLEAVHQSLPKQNAARGGEPVAPLSRCWGAGGEGVRVATAAVSSGRCIRASPVSSSSMLRAEGVAPGCGKETDPISGPRGVGEVGTLLKALRRCEFGVVRATRLFVDPPAKTKSARREPPANSGQDAEDFGARRVACHRCAPRASRLAR